jgi:hypothetical protein
MKKVFAVLLVTALFASASALALVLYDDDNPNPSGCKTCVYKAVTAD